jgi:predicted DNA binding CopG/RHH family protein
MDKRITLSESIIRDLKIVAATAGTNSKTYIENLIVNHLIELGYPKKKKK